MNDSELDQSLLISSIKEPKKLGSRLYKFLEKFETYELIRVESNLYRLKIGNPLLVKKNLKSNIVTCDLRVILD